MILLVILLSHPNVKGSHKFDPFVNRLSKKKSTFLEKEFSKIREKTILVKNRFIDCV